MGALPGCLALLLFVGVVAAGCGGDEPAQSRRPPIERFSYDQAAPLGLRDRGATEHRRKVAVHEVSFQSPKGGRVRGYLLLPPGRGPFPGVVYMHGAGQDHQSLVRLASELASRGAVALTIDSPFSREQQLFMPGLDGLRQARDLTVQNIVELRRAVDVLQSLPQVDDERVAFVGLSAGARVGALLSGVERRIKAYVLMSGGAVRPRVEVADAPEEFRGRAIGILSSTDALRFVHYATPAELLFQNGSYDSIVPRTALEALARAASEPKEIRWYSTDHGLSNKAEEEHMRWLARKLSIGGAS